MPDATMNEYVVFDATDPAFYRGRVSLQFTQESNDCTNVWFFQPIDWVPAEGSEWYGCIAASLTKTLMTYSCGFATQAEARSAADEWQVKIDGRRRHRVATLEKMLQTEA